LTHTTEGPQFSEIGSVTPICASADLAKRKEHVKVAQYMVTQGSSIEITSKGELRLPGLSRHATMRVEVIYRIAEKCVPRPHAEKEGSKSIYEGLG
jgi:hypothetical protein